MGATAGTAARRGRQAAMNPGPWVLGSGAATLSSACS